MTQPPLRRKTSASGEEFRVRRQTVALLAGLLASIATWFINDHYRTREDERQVTSSQAARDRDQDAGIAALRTQAEQSPTFRTREIERLIEAQQREHDQLERRVSRLEDRR